MDKSILTSLGLKAENPGTSTGTRFLSTNGAKTRASYSPVDGSLIGTVTETTRAEYEQVMTAAEAAFQVWRTMPAPKRGEIIRQIGNKLREHKEALGYLVSLEMGKIYQEGLGEVQEMIDICDFAVGLSRQLYGLSMHSERPDHRMYEQWHPLGVVGVISAFNFPVAVWSWNAMIAAVCGDVTVWKPSEKTPLCAMACQRLLKLDLQGLRPFKDNSRNESTGILLRQQRRRPGAHVAQADLRLEFQFAAQLFLALLLPA